MLTILKDKKLVLISFNL